MRKSTTGLLALMLLGAPLTGIHPSSASTTICFGKTTTIANSADEVPGSDTADVILGGTGPTFVYGYAGRDRICDHGAHDDIWGGPGDDLIAAGAGWDTVDGGDGLTLLPSGNDIIYGGPGRDLLTGGDGADRLYGGAGNDTLHGDIDPYGNGAHGAGVNAGRGHLALGGDAASQSYNAPGAGVNGGGYLPQSTGPFGSDRLSGGQGDDVLLGDAGPDSLAGGPGNDTLIGGAGGDVLIGGRGHDAFDGGPGHDTCYVAAHIDHVQSCEAIRTHQLRLNIDSAVPGVAHRPSTTRLRPCVHRKVVGGRVMTNTSAARVQERRCWCRTRPPRTLAAGHETAVPAAQIGPRPAQLALRVSVDGCRWTPRTYGYSTPGTTVPPGR